MRFVHEISESRNSFLAAVHVEPDHQVGSQLALELLLESVELKHVR